MGLPRIMDLPQEIVPSSGFADGSLAFVLTNAATAGEVIRQILAPRGVVAQAYVLAADYLGARGWSLPG